MNNLTINQFLTECKSRREAADAHAAAVYEQVQAICSAAGLEISQLHNAMIGKQWLGVDYTNLAHAKQLMTVDRFTQHRAADQWYRDNFPKSR